MLPVKTRQSLGDNVLLAKILQHSVEGIFLIDNHGQLVYQSPSAKAIVGYEEGMLGSHIASFVHQKDLPLTNRILNDVIVSKSTINQVELRLMHTKGYWIWVECIFSNLLDDPEISGIVIYFRDVTKQRQQKAIQLPYFEKFELLTSVLANSKDAVMITQVSDNGPAWKIIYLNHAFIEMTGYEEAELINKSTKELHGLLLNQEELPMLRDAMARRQPFEQVLQCKRKNGNMYWANCFFSPITDDLGHYTHWVSILHDITSHKELEKLFKKATSLAQIGSWVYDLHNQHIYWSEITKKIYQVPPTFLPNVQNVVHFLVHADANRETLRKISNALTKRKRFDVEIEILTAKKKKRWVRIIGEPEILFGSYLRISGSIQDIDQRKRSKLKALQAVREKNEILESIGDGFFAVNKKWKVVFWNSKAEAELGISKEQLLQKDLWSVFPTSEETLSFKNYSWALKHQKAIHFENYYKALDRWYDISAYPSENGLSIYFKNITEQRKAIEKIVESEKRYHDLFDLSPLPKWIFDIETLKFLDVNKAAMAHYGYAYQEFMSMTILDIRPQQHRDEVAKAISDTMDIKQFTFKGLFTHLKKNGAQIRVSIQTTSTIYNGKRAKLVVAHDMTEQENYIVAIEEKNAKLKQLSWIQSHVFRAPLSKILGLVELAKLTDVDQKDEFELILDYLETAATELDKAIREATLKNS